MGKTVILIPVPSADPVVGKWREMYDHAALHGIPAHITLLFPFKNAEEIDDALMDKLNAIFSKVKMFHFSLYQINSFPKVVFLEPTRREKFIQLTQEIVKVFPENQPYEGIHESIVPHLTLGQFEKSQDTDKTKERMTYDLQNNLPIEAKAQDVWLMEETRGEWSVRVTIPLAF